MNIKLCDTRIADVYTTVLSMCMTDKTLPLPFADDVLLCTEHTTLDDVSPPLLFLNSQYLSLVVGVGVCLIIASLGGVAIATGYSSWQR